MKAIIPVAGIGERLRPFTHTTPKPLLSMAGKPILAHIIDGLIKSGIDELVLVVGYLGEKIEKFVKNRYDIPTEIVWQDELLGLGYAVHLALNHINDDEPFLIVLGDTIIEANIFKILEAKENTIGITWVENPRRFGVVELSGKRIISMEEKPEKPRSNWAIAGLYYFIGAKELRKQLKILVESNIKTKGELQLTDALSRMLSSGINFEAFVIEGWFDCGKSETLLATHRHLLSTNGKTSELPGSIIIPPVHISDSATVENSIIGPFVSIGKNAIIRNAILKDSIVSDGVIIDHCILENSILGNDSSFSGIPFRLNLGDSSKVELEWD